MFTLKSKKKKLTGGVKSVHKTFVFLFQIMITIPSPSIKLSFGGSMYNSKKVLKRFFKRLSH